MYSCCIRRSRYVKTKLKLILLRILLPAGGSWKGKGKDKLSAKAGKVNLDLLVIISSRMNSNDERIRVQLVYTRNQVKGTRQRQKVQQKCSDPCPPKKASITPKIKFVTHKTRYYEVTRGLDLPESCKFSLLGRETCRRCNLPLKLWRCNAPDRDSSS